MRAKGTSVIPAGFDYAATLREIYGKVRSWPRIARLIGFSSGNAAKNIAEGESTPSHPEGERIWIMYKALFPEKQRPPCKPDQIAGMDHTEIRRQLTAPSRKRR